MQSSTDLRISVNRPLGNGVEANTKKRGIARLNFGFQVEKAWFKLKQYLRAVKARTAEALDQAITEALNTITADNAVAWFRHCGYALQN